MKIGLVLIHFVLILTPVAIVGAEVPAVRAEVAAVAIDVALIGADDPTGAAEIRPILLNGGRITRRPILLKLLLVLSNGLPVAVALLPVGAEIPLVLPDVSRVLAHVLAVLAQVALPAPELAPLLLYLRIGNGSGGLRAGARGPDGQCNARGAPSSEHKINQWLTCSALRRDSHTSSPDLPGVVSRATMRRLSRGGIHVAAKTPEQSEVLVDRKDAVVTLTFNRPEARNAMTWNMYERLYQTAEEVDADDSVRVLVLRGAGGKAFVAGTDISQFTSFRTAEDGIQYEREGERRTARLERVGKPVIAQVEGFAVGGGFAIAAVCDIRIATPESRFGFPIARTLGNCLSMENYSRCVDLFGPSRVKEMIMRARLITAEEAHAAGFVHEIVPANEIGARVRAIAEEIAAHAPITLRVTKEAVRRIQERRRLEGGDDLIALTYTSADFREGMSAFLEKRPPRWTGK